MIWKNLSTALIILGVSSPAFAQTRGPKLDVGVRVARATIRGDTIDLGYVVENRPASPMSIGTLALVTPVNVLALDAPADRHSWETFRTHGDDSMPTWAAMGDPIRAGQRSPMLTIRALGITDLVKYFAVPDIDETMKRDTIDDDRPHDRYVEWGATGTVVGVVPAPMNRTPAQQMKRLQAFLARSCGVEQWIIDQATCARFADRVKGASDAIDAGNMGEARTHLSAFLADLDAQHGQEAGKPVTAPAYALLRPNAAFLMR